MESVLLAEKEYCKKKMGKDREKFKLNTGITFDHSIVESIHNKAKEINKKNLKEKMEMMQKLKKVTLELRLEKDKVHKFLLLYLYLKYLTKLVFFFCFSIVLML